MRGLDCDRASPTLAVDTASQHVALRQREYRLGSLLGLPYSITALGYPDMLRVAGVVTPPCLHLRCCSRSRRK
jgi:hypothetical protein